MLSTIITNNWNLKSIDIKTAFLQGDNNQIWKLNKCVYGLTDALLMQLKRVYLLMKITGHHQLRTQHYLLWHHNDKLIRVMTVHMDDF